MNKLYDAVAQDSDYLHAALGRSGSDCVWGAAELEVFRRIEERQASKPRLLLPNSVLLDSDSAFTLAVGNVQAGEPHQLEQVRTLQMAEHPHAEPGPLQVHCTALAAAAKLVHPDRPTVAVLTKPIEVLALRTRIDVRGVGRILQETHGVRPVYVSMRDLARSSLDERGDLCLPGGERASVIYSRYDFSHPLGRFTSDESEIPQELLAEWEAIQRMERSTAVISSRLGVRLAHRRGVQHALTASGSLERFLSDAEAAEVRRVLPEQWHLGCTEGLEAARALVEASTPEADGTCGFVAKNLLRPRTGSGRTQDRADSGGVLVSDHAALRALLGDERRRQWYLLYRRVASRRHDAQLVLQDTGEQYLLRDAVSELAVYGAFLADASGEVVTNVHAGFGVRTRPAAATHRLAPALGYGALGCCEAEDA